MSDLQASALRESDGTPTAGESGGSQGGGTGKSEGIENRSHRRKGLMGDGGCDLRGRGFLKILVVSFDLFFMRSFEVSFPFINCLLFV